MRFVITGGFGFIGKHLLAELSKLEEVELVVIALKITREDRDFLLNFGINAVLIEGNLEELELAPIVHSANAVIHLAWQSNPAITGTDVDAELLLNWSSSKRIIDACAEEGVKLIFLSSGGTVYGEPKYLPIDELHPTNPTSAYGIVKLKVEDEIKKIHKSDGMEYLIIRPSNAYGPGYDLRKGYGVIGFWADKIKKGDSITIMGDGEIRRDFIHVSDLAKGIAQCLTLKNLELNIGSGYSISLNELKNIFESVLGRPLTFSNIPSRPFDTIDNCLSISKIQKLTEWRPTTKLESGISNLLSDN